MATSFRDELARRGLGTTTTEQPPRDVVVPIIRDDTLANRYLEQAVTAEVQRVELAPEGTRNHALNTAAFNLGQLIAGAGLNRAHVEGRLTEAARVAGLTLTESLKTIASGLTAGQEQPRNIPDPKPVDPITTAIPPFDPGADPDQALREFVATHLVRIDWHALWADETEEEWIVEPLLPARRLIALYSAPKVGKSLLMLEIAVAIATGGVVLGVTIDRPRNVLYVDFENDPKADVRARLIAMQILPGELDRLNYLSFPTLGALDSERGSRELVAAIQEWGVEVVVIDTVSRAIAGEENENDTWLAFYRHTGLKLKQLGVSLVRLDHSGKDETKGQRGGSAKSGDVDAVWRLSRITDDSYRLDCEAARMPIVEKTLVLHRESYPLRHRVDAEGRAAAGRIKVEEIVKILDEAGADPKISSRDAQDLVRAAGLKARTGLIGDALKSRRNRMWTNCGESVSRERETDLETTCFPLPGKHSETGA